MPHPHLPLLLFFLLLLPPSTQTHNWMTYPPAYTPKTFNCDPNNHCTTACPPTIQPGPPVATYRRGDTVRITWNRNNHHGGMYRLSLVPLSLRYHRPSHTRFTLKHGCWETGEHDCAPDEDCGTDRGGEAYATSLEIPSVYPDGDYIMGYVWYGGLRYQRDLGLFSDYYSCAVVRVSGGARLGGSYTPFFEAGEGRRIENGMCRTSADRVGDCESGCPTKPSFTAIPAVFRDGTWQRIRVADVRRAARGGDLGGGEAEGAEGEEDRGEREGADRREEDGGEGDVDRGICVGRVCCASRCGRCGGRGCQRLPGGGEECCYTRIVRSGRICGEGTSAPCVI